MFNFVLRIRMRSLHISIEVYFWKLVLHSIDYKCLQFSEHSKILFLVFIVLIEIRTLSFGKTLGPKPTKALVRVEAAQKTKG